MFLSEQTDHTRDFCNFVLLLLQYILTHNIFTFMGQLYLQIQGVAMGTACAPNYANLYLGHWERQLFQCEKLQPFLSYILCWHRFIDDVLVIWTGSGSELQEFMSLLNDNLFNLRFTFTAHQQQISFLDLTIQITPDLTLSTDLYRKPSTGNTILHATSSHPQFLVDSIPFAQYLRLKRNCTSEEDFFKQAKQLRDRLLCRGYTSTCLRKAFNKANSRTRYSLLYPNKRDNTMSTIPIITKYSVHHRQLAEITNRHWHLLADHNILKKYVRPQSQLVFRRAKSLKDSLVRSQYASQGLSPRLPNGLFKCGHCTRCTWIGECTHFRLPNGSQFKYHFHAHCGTKGVIYLLNCQCGAYYVGKTFRELRQRIGDHVYDVTNGKLTTIGRHVGLHHRYDASFISFQVLEAVRPDPRGGNWNQRLLQSETLWIERLEAYKFPGLNEAHSYKAFL